MTASLNQCSLTTDACPRARLWKPPIQSTAVTKPLFTGVGVALVTLFRDDGSVDAPATAEHARRLADLGIRAIVVAGSTGEAAALDADERVRVLAAVRDA